MVGPPYRTVRLGFDPYREINIWYAKHGEVIDSILFSCRIAMSEMAKFTHFWLIKFIPICSMMLYVWYIYLHLCHFWGFYVGKYSGTMVHLGYSRTEPSAPQRLHHWKSHAVSHAQFRDAGRCRARELRWNLGDSKWPPFWFLEDFFCCFFSFVFFGVFFSQPNVFFFGSDTRYTRNRHISSSVSWGRDIWNSSVWTWQSIWNSCAS